MTNRNPTVIGTLHLIPVEPKTIINDMQELIAMDGDYEINEIRLIGGDTLDVNTVKELLGTSLTFFVVSRV